MASMYWYLISTFGSPNSIQEISGFAATNHARSKLWARSTRFIATVTGMLQQYTSANPQNFGLGSLFDPLLRNRFE